MAEYTIGQRVGVALVRGSREHDFTAVITEVPEGRSPYYVGTGTDAAGDPSEFLFYEREIVTTLPSADDVESVEAWLNGR